MTKVQVRFRIENALDENMLQKIAAVHAIYGIQRVKVDPSMQTITVEYDATRLRPAEVEAALAQAGIAVAPVSA